MVQLKRFDETDIFFTIPYGIIGIPGHAGVCTGV